MIKIHQTIFGIVHPEEFRRKVGSSELIRDSYKYIYSGDTTNPNIITRFNRYRKIIPDLKKTKPKS